MSERMLVFAAIMASASAWGQLVPPTLNVRTIGDKAQVVNHRSGEIEMLAAQRAVVVTEKTGKTRVAALKVSSAEKPFSPQEQGVVFNYALQQYGLVIGEIAFKLKPSTTTDSIMLGPQFAVTRISDSGVYAIWARTPAEWLQAMRALQGASAVLWVQPTIQYGVNF